MAIAYLTTQTLPAAPFLWLFFAAWLIALTGTAIPFAHYLNKRFAKILPPDAVMLRQALWVGLFGASCAWLQLGRALNWASALLLAAALIAIEGFLLLRERSKRPFDEPSTPAKR
jgi:drug/metabolite transporter (DMT)-like permease